MRNLIFAMTAMAAAMTVGDALAAGVCEPDDGRVEKMLESQYGEQQVFVGEALVYPPAAGGTGSVEVWLNQNTGTFTVMTRGGGQVCAQVMGEKFTFLGEAVEKAAEEPDEGI